MERIKLQLLAIKKWLKTFAYESNGRIEDRIVQSKKVQSKKMRKASVKKKLPKRKLKVLSKEPIPIAK